MEEGDDLWTDSIGPSPDSPPPPSSPDSPPPPLPPGLPPLWRPPEPEGDPPPSPESYSTPVSLLDWGIEKLECLRTGIFVLLGTFGFLQEETLERFKELERSAGAKALNDSWIDSLWPTQGPSTASGLNETSTSRASSSMGSTAFDPNVSSTSKKSFLMGESSTVFDPNVPSTSKKSFLMGESSTAFDPNVPSTSKKSFSKGESSTAFDPNVPSTSKKSFWMGESSTAFDPNMPSTSKKSFLMSESSIDLGSNMASTFQASSCMDESSMDCDPYVPSTSQASSWMGESSMDLDPNLPSTSQALLRKRKCQIPTQDPSSGHDDAAVHFGREFASRGNPLLKGIEDFCAKYLRHNDVCNEIKDELVEVETNFVIKRSRRAHRTIDRIDVGKFMALLGGVKALRNLAEKIVREQKILCNKLHYIMRRKARLDQLFKDSRNLSSMARKDNPISYSIYWIYKNLVVVDRIMVRKRKMHNMFEAVKRKLIEELSHY